MRQLCLLLALVPFGTTACKKGDPAPAAAEPVKAAPPAPAAAGGCTGFKGDKPSPFCLETAPEGCKLEDVKEDSATIKCTNGSFSLNVYDTTQESLDSEITSLTNRTKDATTKIFEQGVPAAGGGKFITYMRADQPGMTNAYAVVKGKTHTWVCNATISDARTAERDKFLNACKSLKD